MFLAKLFTNGRSQAIRLPKECRFNEKEVMINKIGDILIVTPSNNKWESLTKSIDLFSNDYFENGRIDEVNVKREDI